ncbi:5754_t:CDS:2 [Funneliformis mosseae]|uniref:5754_t:CDS:1 n=1 Tax=Funneliformis mosseae TaxID=27381 RepID=A0A9N9ATT2_FUNMO|nr:5754_t:CDS:2 [Funneliformis mosseae]
MLICARLLEAHRTLLSNYTVHRNLYSKIRCKPIISKIPLTSRSNNHFSFPISRSYSTTVNQNPQKDEQGKDMHIEITDRATNQLKSILERENSSNNALRVTVDSGGCHGFQYCYDLTEQNNIKDEDVVFENNGVKVIVDEISLSMIKGSKIDYTQELLGSQFQVVDNPQAASGCGCGVSFEIKV